MTLEKIEEILFLINTTLGKIETKISGVCEVLALHEHRITTLEKTKTTNSDDTWKNQLLMLLAKSLIIGLTSIVTLVGGSGLVSQILSSSNNNTPSIIQQK